MTSDTNKDYTKQLMFTVVLPSQDDFKKPINKNAMCWHRCISVFAYNDCTTCNIGVNIFDNPYDAVYYVEDYIKLTGPSEADRVRKLLELFKEDMGDASVKAFLFNYKEYSRLNPDIDAWAVQYYPCEYIPRELLGKPHPYKIIKDCKCDYCEQERANLIKAKSGLLPEEQEIMDHLVEAWNAFIRLPMQHASDESEFCVSIHKLEYLLGIRIVRRERPEYWVNESV